ncbi:HAMP domain-containing sensor histidine kinase [Nocardioides sp. C4-1]|uniref:sensor histidine kinase n=1 Tax=Nocardioides sp. C4-1 TaxID=3151851 RepID=UPI003266840D
MTGALSADDPLTPGFDLSTWSDAGSRDALDLVTASVAEMVQFEVATIGVIRGGLLHPVTVEGSHEAAAELFGHAYPVAAIDHEIARAESWGRFRFVAQEQRETDEDPIGWVPDLEPLDGLDAWRPLDLLLAPLHDVAGTMIGLLSIDLPLDRRRPDRRRVAVLERYAVQAERALRMAVERDALAERMRLTETARRVVRFAASQDDLESVLDDVREPLQDGFRADFLAIRTYPSPDLPSAGSPPTDLPAPTKAVVRAAARRAWAEQCVIVMGPDGVLDPELDVGTAKAVQETLDHLGLQSLMLVPLGIRDEPLGHLVLGRRTAERWSTDEQVSALEITSDVGQAIAGSRARAREVRLVEELRQLTTYKTQLLNTVSHELKNPLAAVTGYLELLTGDPRLSTTAQTSVRATGRAAARMGRIVDDLLVLAQVEDPGRAAGADARADVVAVAHDAVTLLQAEADAAGVDVVVEPPPGAVPVARCTATDLERVLTNLVGNAVKYSPSGEVVTVAVGRRDDDVVVEVVDRGLGISDADQARLFTEFFRSTNPEALARPGTGLGLTICHRILEQAGGRIEVESTLGEGSTFRAVVPAA